jgi:bifunctional non-homologous end joining protein LigD
MSAARKTATLPKPPWSGAAGDVRITLEGKDLQLTNLGKVFWPEEGHTKGDLLRYYHAVAPQLLPHLRSRAMVMKRYPNGIAGKFFFMKRAPSPRPPWLEVCRIAHENAGIIDFPVIHGLAELLWVVNLGCIDLNPWYARCDDTDRPDYLHFDLDPVEGKPAVPLERVCKVAMIVRDALSALGLEALAKTTGSRGLHLYVAIERGPTQKEVWHIAKSLALTLAARHPELITAEYRIAKRPPGRVLVDYNQNAWGRTLASVYSVRPRPRAPVSTPVTWSEVERGFDMADFRMETVPARVRKLGDLWAPLLAKRGRARLDRLLQQLLPRRRTRGDAA